MKKIFPYLFSAVAIPLSDSNQWKEVSFGNIRPNEVRASEAGLLVTVKKSASPLVYRLTPPQEVQSFLLEGELKSGSIPHQEGFGEDFYLRLGLVAEGSHRLSGIKKLFAAHWVKELFALVPEGTGLDKIYFFNIGNAENKLGTRRTHPKSELMTEEVVSFVAGDATQTKVHKNMTEKMKIHGIWLSLDGDDTKSDFSFLIQKIILNIDSEASTRNK